MEQKTGFWSEFKAFISRGNVLDLSVGVIVGTAFTAIVNSLVNDVVMPVAGIVLGGLKFTNLKWVFRAATEETAEVALYYGNFIQSVVNFLLIALMVFLLVKGINRLHRKKAEEAPAPEPEPAPIPEDILLLREIRDLLKPDQEG